MSKIAMRDYKEKPEKLINTLIINIRHNTRKDWVLILKRLETQKHRDTTMYNQWTKELDH